MCGHSSQSRFGMPETCRGASNRPNPAVAGGSGQQASRSVAAAGLPEPVCRRGAGQDGQREQAGSRKSCPLARRLAALALAVSITGSTTGCKLLPSGWSLPAQAADKANDAEKVRRLAEEGLKFEQVGNYRRAYKTYKRALALAGRSAWLHHRLASVCDRLAKFAEAEHHYLRALALAPPDPDLHNDLGYSYYLQGRLWEAERELRTCLALSPSHCYAHINLGLVLGRRGKSEESLKHFQLAGMNQQQAYASLAFVLPGTRRPPTTNRAKLTQQAQSDIPPALQRYFEPAKEPGPTTADHAVRLGQHLEPIE